MRREGSKSVADKTEENKPAEPAKSDKNDDNPLDSLREASKGLLFMSESDRPVKPLLWKADGDTTKSGPISEDALKKDAKIPDGATIKPLTVEEFFKPATEKQDWFGPDETASADKFQALVDFMQKNLTDTKVFRVENSHPDDKSLIDVYVVGKTTGGDWAGVSTQLVET